MIFKKSCKAGRKSHACRVKPPKREGRTCSVGGIESTLRSASDEIRLDRTKNPVNLAAAKYFYLLAKAEARGGGKSCVKRTEKLFARFREKYPDVMKAKLADRFKPGGSYDPFG